MVCSQCGHSDRLGVIVIGDSAGAHFSIPPKYFNVTMWQSIINQIIFHRQFLSNISHNYFWIFAEDTFNDLLYRASDELDLPYLSASSGYESVPFVHSFYQRVYELNRCNRNDYQNLGVNGKNIDLTENFIIF